MNLSKIILNSFDSKFEFWIGSQTLCFGHIISGKSSENSCSLRSSYEPTVITFFHDINNVTWEKNYRKSWIMNKLFFRQTAKKKKIWIYLHLIQLRHHFGACNCTKLENCRRENIREITSLLNNIIIFFFRIRSIRNLNSN